jgi:hypothetical protein
MISIRSTDNGATWEATVAIEPPTGVESSYAVMLKKRRAAQPGTGRCLRTACERNVSQFYGRVTR